jgi:hypothetical protein
VVPLLDRIGVPIKVVLGNAYSWSAAEPLSPLNTAQSAVLSMEAEDGAGAIGEGVETGRLARRLTTGEPEPLSPLPEEVVCWPELRISGVVINGDTIAGDEGED